MSTNQNNDKSQLNEQPECRKLLKSLFEQKVTGFLCDVLVRVQDSEMWAHACVLVSCSSYFTDLFRQSWENHWCSKKPLVIDLDKVSTVDSCPICVGKIIDFMYLREIVVLRGHCEHFCKIAKFLEVFDLLPLCKKYFQETLSQVTNDYSVKKFNDILPKYNSNNSVEVVKKCSILTRKQQMTENALENQSKDSLANEPNDLPVSSYDIKENMPDVTFTNKKKKTEQYPNNLEVFSSENTHSLKSSKLKKTKTTTDPIADKQNYKIEKETVLKKECEFLCCNAETDIPSYSKGGKREKRKLICDKCQYSTVFVPKMLKHLNTSNHFGKVCPICNKQTKDLIELKQHLNDHLHSKPFKCDICKKRYRFWLHHKQHLKVHCRNKQYYCDVCQKGFKQYQYLTAHLLTHKKTKSYSCIKCDYFTSDLNIFQSHILQHNAGKDLVDNNSGVNSIICSVLATNEKIKEIHCQVCGKGFTQKRNLKRHIQLKHFSVTEYNCSVCTYVTKRFDLLKHHMKKQHNCTPQEIKGKQLLSKEEFSKKQQQIQESTQGSTDVIGVLIPVQLVSTNDTSSTLNAFAVTTCRNEHLEHEEIAEIRKPDMNQNQSNNFELDIISETIEYQSPKSHLIQVSDNKVVSTIQNKIINKPHILENLPSSAIDLWDKKTESLHSLPSNNDKCPMMDPDKQSRHTICEDEVNLSTNFSRLKKLGLSNTSETNKNIHPGQQEISNVNIMMKTDNSRRIEGLKEGHDFLDMNEGIWLNEATGELLNESSFVNVRVIDGGPSVDHNHHMSTITEKTSFDHFQTIVFNETAEGLSVFDLGDDTEDLTSNPQTPQTNLVEFDDPDNIFGWNHLDTSFCSTWVLNEITGELNMVSFGIQPLKSNSELKLDESTGMFSNLDDDETALFLNEGTGDLSVIYFNLSKRECTSPKHSIEHLSQDALETLSEHSNDEDDLLNEEFLMASASFMAHNGNETFLNELTGEFDNANFTNYRAPIQETQISENKSIYLNEETGEISWNVLDQNVQGDIFTNSDILRYDFDDSFNCDDLEPFSSEINGFSSQFCLSSNNNNSHDWHTVDETCDTLLNECTGEFIRRN